MDVRQLSDLYEIQRLKARYFYYVDTHQWDALRELFTDDLELYNETTRMPAATTPTLTGGDALVAYLASSGPAKLSIHQGHTPDIDFVDDKILQGEGQTAIGDGLALSNYVLSRQATREARGHQVIVLFTDGENNRGLEPVDVLAESKAAGIRVHVIGVDLERDVKEKPSVQMLMAAVDDLGEPDRREEHVDGDEALGNLGGAHEEVLPRRLLGGGCRAAEASRERPGGEAASGCRRRLADAVGMGEQEVRALAREPVLDIGLDVMA